MKIVIPSHKRHDKVSTTKVVNDAILCVEESQRDLYKEFNPNTEIVTHPDSLKGLSRKRNWILDHFGDVFQIDDDIKALRRTYLAPKQKKDKFTPEQVTAIIQDTYNMIKEQTDIKYFGFAKSPSPLHYDVSKPIFMNSFVQGCGMGVIADSKLRWPEIDSMTGQDEWICMLNARFHRKMWVDKRFFFDFDRTNFNIGGCGEFRNEDSKKESFLYLKKHFGKSIKVDPKSKELKWRLNIPY